MTEEKPPARPATVLADSLAAFPPAEIAHQVERVGVQKARMDGVSLLVLAVLAGAYISLGALLFTVIVTGSDAGFGLTRLIGGLGFCLGLILVVIGGAELFTGNNLIAVAWAGGRVGLAAVARNWALAYLGNVIGCLGTVALVLWTDVSSLAGGAVGETAVGVAAAKAELSFGQAFARGILCNALVCLAVWLTLGGRSLTDKLLAIIFPITAFVAIGFEHSIANWFFLPFGLLLDTAGTVDPAGAASNIVAVTLGNVVGGTLLVAGVYWLAYLRNEEST